ncbi:integrin beta-PS [Amyelois transitella]|uniref:integrin beta-PS n=1 Tax=Amyelois transitella TaxID=680683 RepID=UPI00067D5C1D|nr:integrin beta-PS [Amyelois transitella]
MAPIFFFMVLITIPIQWIFAFNCNSVEYETIMDCDQCIKCGGHWCISPGPNESHCSRLSFGETRCTSYNEKEIFQFFPRQQQDGNKTSIIRPVSFEDSIKVSDGERNKEFSTPSKVNIDVTPIDYLGSTPDVKLVKKKCDKDTCTQKLVVSLDSDFCSDTGGPVQHFVVPLKIDDVIHAKGQYSVPCACQCSRNVSVNDAYCNGRGNLSCGVCKCKEDWRGPRCEQKAPYDEREYVEPDTDGSCPVRGDISCRHEMRPDVDCSGNGRCEDCCICDRTQDGWQYFDGNNYCEDICMTTSEILEKDSNLTSVHLITYDEEVSRRRDSKNRSIWVECEETVNDCKWTYLARKNVRNEIAIMISKKSCPNAEAVVGGGMNVTALVVPLVVAAALAMAGVGYYVWQSKGGAPQLNKANYQGLEGPKTRVETNPVYIEPIKSYKNPTYGQQV